MDRNFVKPSEEFLKLNGFTMTLPEISVTAAYEPHEIYLSTPKVTVKVAKGKAKKKDCYHLTVNLPPEARNFFKEALQKCGFKDITAWVNHCFERLKVKYAQILEDEKEKDFAPAGKQKSEA